MVPLRFYLTVRAGAGASETRGNGDVIASFLRDEGRPESPSDSDSDCIQVHVQPESSGGSTSLFVCIIANLVQLPLLFSSSSSFFSPIPTPITTTQTSLFLQLKRQHGFPPRAVAERYAC